MPKKKQDGGAAPVQIRITGREWVMRPIDSVVPYARNAKVHDKSQVARLRASLREFGFVRPLLIDETGNLIAGHGTLEAARAEGMTEVPCVVAAGLTDAQRRAYILADNRLAEMAPWDQEMLALEVQDLEALDVDLGMLDLGELLPGDDEDEEPEAQDDDYDGQVPEECLHNPGDVFKLGRHILVCGDCRDPNVAKKFQRGGG